MMISRRSFQGQADIASILDLTYAIPANANWLSTIHIMDMPYRLASWSLDSSDNCSLWEDEYGDLLAFAIIQEPFLSIDLAVRAGLRSASNQISCVGH